MTKGYHNYRGRGRKRRQKIALAAALTVVILAAAAFLVLQNYIVYDDAGKAHVEWPFGKKDPQTDTQNSAVPDSDVNITMWTTAMRRIWRYCVPGCCPAMSCGRTP